ncbi:polysaccharide biosynthesis/export family protein [Novosphingobium sp. M1R2S20]|uniref:Polysaccharide biosynthesis/export family protein n=1 Tax=Novosphingobium rhizovicinum TaxID=3228928 RepID=A0ABV3RG21_9SPHN
MVSHKAWVAALSLALSLGGCGNGLSQLAALPSSPVNTYRVGVGDELRVMIPELTEGNGANVTYVVNEGGNLSLPVLGDVPASGKTVPELQQDLVQRLVSARLLSAPTVSVQPVRLRPIYVLGEVQKPGEYAFSPGMSVLSAIAAAGGYTFRAKESAVGITRIIDGKQTTGRASENDMLQPGDAIRVYERWL